MGPIQGVNVGKYTVRPMDPSWDLKLHKKLKGAKKVGPGKPIVTNGVRVTWAPKINGRKLMGNWGTGGPHNYIYNWGFRGPPCRHLVVLSNNDGLGC